MIKYEFMRAHGKGSEGSERRGGGGEKKGGARSTGTPPVYAPAKVLNFDRSNFFQLLKVSLPFHHPPCDSKNLKEPSPPLSPLLK